MLFRETQDAESVSGFWPFRSEVKVAWRDLDAAGHVNNAVYLTYMETARTECYFALNGGSRPEDLDIILARASVDFRSAATLGDTLVVEVRPGRVGETSFTLLYAIRNKSTGALVAEGESVIVAYDYAKDAKRPLSADLRAKLAA